MNVTLSPELSRFIDAEVKAGHYATTDDAINAAVAQLQSTAEFSPSDVEDLRRDLDVGIAEADRREFVDFTAEQVIAERRAARQRRR